MALKLPRRFRRRRDEPKFVVWDDDPPASPPPPPTKRWGKSLLACLVGLFSSKKKRVAAVNRARTSVERAIELIEEKEEKLTSARDKWAVAVATAMQDKRISEAVQHLKKKKYYEKQLQRHRQHRFNLDTQLVCLEEALTNTGVADAMKSVTLALKRAGRQFGDTEDTIDDLQEIISEACDVSQMLQEQITHPDYLDEEALRRELEGDSPPPPPKETEEIPILPIQPSTEPVVVAPEDEDLALI